MAASVFALFATGSSPWTKAVLSPGVVLAEREANINILNQLAENEADQDGWVVVTSEPLMEDAVYSYVGLTTDGEWPSGTLAYYFGKENARIEWKD